MQRTRLYAGLAIAVTVMSACDPQAAAVKIFSDQGLQLLKPARSYIEVGGLFVVPRQGNPFYVDRQDALALNSESNPQEPFKATILAESKKSTLSLGAAVGIIQSFLPVSLDTAFDKAQAVSLSQIETTGNRIKYPTLNSLVTGTTNTGSFAKDQLAAKNGDRVFVVWEVYSGKSFTLTSDSDLKAGIGVNRSIPATKSAQGGDAKNASPAPAPSAAVALPVFPAGASVPKSPAAIPTKEPDESGDKGGGALTWKQTGNYKLALNATDPYPFAVRLAEVVLTPAGLRLKAGGFKFPSGNALGGEDAQRREEFTTVVDPNAPLAVERRTLKK